MFEEMVWFGYLPAPVAEIDQKMKQDVTGLIVADVTAQYVTCGL